LVIQPSQALPPLLRRGTMVSKRRCSMEIVMFSPILAAAGYSLIYLLMGGGLGGAILIFVVLKMLGK